MTPERETMKRAERDKAEGKAPSTQAGEFIREEMHHIREGKHGARSSRQAIAIGLSKARRAGVKLPPPKRGSVQLRHKAAQDLARGRHPVSSKISPARSRATSRALKREGTSAASRTSLSRHAHASARRRSAAERSSTAQKAARTRSHLHRHS